MGVPLLRSRLAWLLLAALALAAAWRLWSGGKYEYEEVLALELDGSATLDVNASIAALVALYGAPFDPAASDPPDAGRVRALFAAPGIDVDEVTFFRRGGRPFAHVSLDLPAVQQLAQSPPFAGYLVQFERRGDAFVFQQTVRPAAPDRPPRALSWSGAELSAIRVHAPSEVLFENATSDVERGNLLVWERPLAAHLAGEPIELHVEMATESILVTTLTLFAATIVAAALTVGVIVALVVRKGRTQASVPAAPR